MVTIAKGETSKKHVDHYRHYHFKPTLSHNALRANIKNITAKTIARRPKIIIIVSL